MVRNLDRMKKLAKLSGVPLQRILKFQKRESDNGILLAGDQGKSGGDLHLHRNTALLLTRRGGLLANKKLYDKIKSLKTTPGKKQVSEYSTWLVKNEEIQDKLLVALLKDTTRMADNYVKKIFNREPADHEYYAYWNSKPETAMEGIATHFKSRDPNLKTLQFNIKGFLKQDKSYLQDDIDVDEKYKIPTTRSKIAAWMKKYGWKSKDIGKMVDGKWVGYHPGDTMVQPKKEKSPPKEQITGTAKETVTDKDLQRFDLKEGDDPKTTAPSAEYLEKLKIKDEGSGVPFVQESVEEKEEVKDYVPSHTTLDQLPEDMKAKEPPTDIIEEYQQRTEKDVMKLNEGGLIPPLPDDPEEKKRVTGQTDIISEAVEDKVEGTQLEQEEPGDTTKMSIPEVQAKLKETLEVSSEPGSDVIKLTTRPDQVKKRKVLKEALTEKKALVEAGPPDEPGIRQAQKLGITDPSQQVVNEQVKDEQITEKTAQPPVDVEPKAFNLQSFIQQTMQRDEDARKIMNEQLAAAADVENKIQKVEPFRFWNNMSTPAKIVAGIGMLIGGYAAKDSPSGLQAVMNVIDGAVNADIQAQKLTQQQQLVVAKEATRRAKAAVDRYKATATSPQTKAKLMELAQALEVKRVGIAKKQQLQHLRGYVMNQARSGKLHLVPPSLMRMVYPKEDMKRIDSMRTDYEKERKERKIQPVLSAYRRMHNLISRDEEISGMDDIAIVFSFMKLLDPGSVVRESEFETAANAGPRAKYFARQWNRFITGGRFTQSDRKGFLKSALNLVKPALDEEKQLQKKYISMSRRYGYPAAFIIPQSTRYFDLPGTMDEAAIRKIMKERGKTYEEASDIHNQVAKRQAAKPRVSRATKHRQKMGF